MAVTIKYPGTHVMNIDAQTDRKIMSLCFVIENVILEAELVLEMYEKAQQESERKTYDQK